MANPELEKKVLAKVEELEPELIKVCLDIGDMPSFQPNEAIAGEYVYQWYRANGFDPKKVGNTNRYNVLAKYPGAASTKARSLLFCSHLDIGRTTVLDILDERNEQVIKLWSHGWRDGDYLVGNGIGNDKGSMSCWMIAVKALKEAGIKLPGDLLMTSVVGETAGSPVDEFQSPEFDSHELGARYVATHGAMADFALVAEATDFTICPVECGFAYFKVTIYSGPASYTPFFPYPEPSMAQSVSPILRMAKFLERYNEYAVQYMKKYTYSFDGGEVVPKTIVGAIRGGQAHAPAITPEKCSIYIDYRTPPGIDPLVLQRDLQGLLAETGMDGRVEMFKYLPGYEGWKVKDYNVFKKSLVGAHAKIFNAVPRTPAVTQTCSMWRDINTFNELGVPAITYGFPAGYSSEGVAYDLNLFRVKIKDMVNVAKVYSLLALDICNQPL